MARKITEEDKIQINILYVKYKTYAGVARETGFAPTTVKKYIIKDFVLPESIKIKEFHYTDLPETISSDLSKVSDMGELCTMSDVEKEEIKDLWKELVL